MQRIVKLLFWLLLLGILTSPSEIWGSTKKISIYKGANDSLKVILPTLDSLFKLKLKPGDELVASAAEDWVHITPKNQQYYIVRKHAPVYLKVIQFKKPRGYGRPGKIDFMFWEVYTDGPGYEDSYTIPLDSTVRIRGEGKGKILPYILFPVGWLMKGGEPEAYKESMYVHIRFGVGQEYLPVKVMD